MPKQKKKSPVLHSVVILDESGSMSTMGQAVLSGFNEYVQTLRTTDPDASLTLVLFNSERYHATQYIRLADVPLLTAENYRPRTQTPLYDAIGRMLTEADGLFAVDDRVAVVIYTDGEENDSREYDRPGIFRLIKDREVRGWAFIFLGTNQDSYLSGSAIGVGVGNTSNYTPKSAAQAMGAVAPEAVSTYFRTGQTQHLVSDTARASLGDHRRIDGDEDGA